MNAKLRFCASHAGGNSKSAVCGMGNRRTGSGNNIPDPGPAGRYALEPQPGREANTAHEWPPYHPIWNEPPPGVWVNPAGQFCNEERAGGCFMLMPEGADQLRDRRLTERQKVNLSHWIHDHNIRIRCSTNPWRESRICLNWTKLGVVDHRDCEPSPEDRMLNFLRELIRSDDAGVPPDEADRNLLKAAGGCRHDDDLQELLLYAINKDWLGGGGDPGSPFFPRPNLINHGLGARIQVDEQLRARGGDQRGGDQQAVVPDPAGNESEFTIPNIRESADRRAGRTDHRSKVGRGPQGAGCRCLSVSDFPVRKRPGRRPAGSSPA